MLHDDALATYRRDKLGGRAIPDDLRKLLVLQWERGTAHDAEGADPLAGMWVQLFDAGQSSDLLDHSYLNDDDRANPDIMANVAAMTTVCAHCLFVAQNDDGVLFGYWFGPENLPIESAPIVKLDTEGQFELIGGKTLSEALVGDRVFDDDAAFARLRGQFGRAGIAFTASSWDELDDPDAPTDPAVLHDRCYRENRAKAGLPPIS